MPTLPEIKPCPYPDCESSRCVLETDLSDAYYVICQSCGFSSPVGVTEEDAIENWDWFCRKLAKHSTETDTADNRKLSDIGSSPSGNTPAIDRLFYKFVKSICRKDEAFRRWPHSRGRARKKDAGAVRPRYHTTEGMETSKVRGNVLDGDPDASKGEPRSPLEEDSGADKGERDPGAASGGEVLEEGALDYRNWNASPKPPLGKKGDAGAKRKGQVLLDQLVNSTIGLVGSFFGLDIQPRVPDLEGDGTGIHDFDCPGCGNYWLEGEECPTCGEPWADAQAIDDWKKCHPDCPHIRDLRLEPPEGDAGAGDGHGPDTYQSVDIPKLEEIEEALDDLHKLEEIEEALDDLHTDELIHCIHTDRAAQILFDRLFSKPNPEGDAISDALTTAGRIARLKAGIDLDPEGDAGADQRDNYYSKAKNLFFKYCGECKSVANTGGEHTCESCLHNREVVQRLHKQLYRFHAGAFKGIRYEQPMQHRQAFRERDAGAARDRETDKKTESVHSLEGDAPPLSEFGRFLDEQQETDK